MTTSKNAKECKHEWGHYTPNDKTKLNCSESSKSKMKKVRSILDDLNMACVRGKISVNSYERFLLSLDENFPDCFQVVKL